MRDNNDLISRSELIKHIRTHIEACKSDNDFRGVDAWTGALWDVQEAPSVDAKYTKHEHWDEIYTSGFSWEGDGLRPCVRTKYKHKTCGKIVARKEKYCPECGATMY